MTNVALWLVDWLFSGMLILAAGGVAVALCAHIVFRERIAELTLAAAVLAAIPAAVPHVHRFSLGLIPPSTPTTPTVHIGLLPWNSVGNKSSAAQAADLPPAAMNDHGRILISTNVINYWEDWLPWAYAAGVMFMLGRLIVGAIILRKIAKDAQRIDLPLPVDLKSQCQRAGVDIAVSSAIASPVATGWRVPVILLPEGFIARPEINAVIAHELAHIRRQDVRWRYVISLANAILFVNPLAYYLASQARLSQEILADRCAANFGHGSIAYAEMLLSLLRAVQPSTRMAGTTTMLLGGRSEMLRRLEYIAAGKSVGPASLGRPLLLGLMTTAAAASAAASAVTLQRACAVHTVTQTTPLGHTSMWRSAQRMRRCALRYLSRRQQPDGAWLGRYGPAVTALVIRAFLRAGESSMAPQVARGLDFIETCRRTNGGYYLLDEPAYNTAIVVRTLSMLHGSTYARRCAKAMAFLRSIARPQQSITTKGLRQWFHARGGMTTPPLVRLAPSQSAAVDAWLGAGQLDPHERAGYVRVGNYGSITYSQLKSMIYAHLSPHDSRVAKLSRWLRTEKALQANPAAHGAKGLFYFCFVYARVMHALENAKANAQFHTWRPRLITLMRKLRCPGGYWKNTASPQWLEGNRIMATTYAALILDNILAR